MKDTTLLMLIGVGLFILAKSQKPKLSNDGVFTEKDKEVISNGSMIRKPIKYYK